MPLRGASINFFVIPAPSRKWARWRNPISLRRSPLQEPGTRIGTSRSVSDVFAGIAVPITGNSGQKSLSSLRIFTRFRTALGKSQPLAYVEMVAGLGALAALNLIFFRDDLGFSNVNPNPIWLVIVFVAARYGAIPGYAVGALSALVYLGLVALQGGPSFAFDASQVQVFTNPVLFLVVGGALGELRESHKRAQKRLAAKYDEVEADIQDLAQRYLAALELSRELERRVVGQTSTVMTLYQAAKGLEYLDVRELSPSVLELTANFIEADACALYLRQEGRFLLEAARPASPDLDRPEELDTTEGMPAIVLRNKGTSTVRDILTDVTPAQLSSERLLMATPLLSEDKEVMGILIVEKMPFLRFTPAAVKLFTLLGDWASSAFQRALRFQRTQDRNVEDELTGAYNYPHTEKRLSEEVVRARQYQVPLTLVALRIDDYDQILPVRVPRVLRTLSLVFRHYTRPIDIVGKYITENVFLIVLPHVGAQEGQSLTDRISREVEAFEFKPFDDDRSLTVTTSLASFSDATTSAEALVDDALRSLQGLSDSAPRGKGFPQ